MTRLCRKKRKKHPLAVLLIPSRGKSIGTVRASVGWHMVPAVCNSARHFRVSYFRRRNPRELTVSKSSRRCRIASGRTRMFTERVRIILCIQLAYILSQRRFRTEILNDDDEDEEQTPAPPTAGDTVPAPPAGEPAESIPSR